MGFKVIKNTKIVNPNHTIKDGFIVIKNSIIHLVGDVTKDQQAYKHFIKEAEFVVDFKNMIAVPGFIDIHVHGGLGKDYSKHPEMISEHSRFLAKHGVTGFLPTIGAMVPATEILTSSSKLIELINKTDGAKALGVNLEGPFLNPEVGAQGPEFCFKEVDMSYLREALSIMGKDFKIITISPELMNAMEAITYLCENGVIAAIGHTRADEETLDQAIRRGARLITHLLNTSYQPEQKFKGIIATGADQYLMIKDELMGEVICDVNAVHVNPTMLKVLIRCKSPDKIALVTDAFMGAGISSDKKMNMPDGREVTVKDGVMVQSLSGHITGSAMTMDLSVNSMIRHAGIGLSDVLKMSSLNQARILRLERKKGSIEPGKDADIIAIDDQIRVFSTIVEGNVVYNIL